ncbi:MAG: ATP-dependent Clp protease ATP-binding subunit [Bacillota bacterium]|nr:ATP-dependent Clp protease ATP-binding subunit [Bacillota bacterium]
MMKCDKCGKNTAVVMIQKIEPTTGHKENMKLCMKCAEEMGIATVEDMKNQLSSLAGMDADSEEAKAFKHFLDEMALGINEEDADDEDFEMEEGEDAYDDGYEEDNGFTEFPLSGMVPYSKDDPSVKGNPGQKQTKEKESEKNYRGKERKKIGKALRKFGENLIDKAVAGKIDWIIGREDEIDRLIQILNRRQKNNPLIIGEPGVGKTAIAEGLAVRIVEGNVPYKLLDTEVIQLDMTGIVAGTQFRGQFEQRMKDIIFDATKHGNVILIIDEVHNIVSAGDSNGAMNAANILKPALAKGEVQIIGATTLDEYRRHIEKDAALERRFQPVIVEEPTVDEAIEILEGIKNYYEEYHKVVIPKESVVSAVKLSKRYISDRYLPDKAIDVIDEAGSRKNLLNKNLVAQKKMTEKFDELRKEHDEASSKGDYERAAELRTEFLRLEADIKNLESEMTAVVDEDDIAFVVEALSKIPVQKIGEEEAKILIELEDRLHGRIIAQNEAVSAVSAAVRRNRSGFRKTKKPSSFIFVGPTGVGKTELAKALAQEIFGSEEAMIRLDMSEYMEKHTVSKLIGSPPGYVGYDDGGQLTEVIRRRPYSVVLLDEIEKAHPDVFNMLLQILDDGRLTDSRGRTVFFENAIIIMTSNVGTGVGGNSIGFGTSAEAESRSKEYVQAKLKEVFRPEFLNRVDSIAVFDKLTKDDCAHILELQLKEVYQNLADKKMSIDIDDSVKKFLLDKGYSSSYGARPLRRAISQYLEDEIAEKYLRRILVDGDRIKAVMDETSSKILLTKIAD